MQIPEKQVEIKKQIGYLHNSPVWYVRTKGGLNLCLAWKNGKIETLGAGSHKAVAKFIARKHHPDIQFNDLEKGEDLDPRCFMDIIPKYELLTRELSQLG